MLCGTLDYNELGQKLMKCYNMVLVSFLRGQSILPNSRGLGVLGFATLKLPEHQKSAKQWPRTEKKNSPKGHSSTHFRGFMKRTQIPKLQDHNPTPPNITLSPCSPSITLILPSELLHFRGQKAEIFSSSTYTGLLWSFERFAFSV